ncbi:Acidic nuclear phosphoprotein 32 family member B [Balamuthia mandrillaris]
MAGRQPGFFFSAGQPRLRPPLLPKRHWMPSFDELDEEAVLLKEEKEYENELNAVATVKCGPPVGIIVRKKDGQVIIPGGGSGADRGNFRVAAEEEDEEEEEGEEDDEEVVEGEEEGEFGMQEGEDEFDEAVDYFLEQDEAGSDRSLLEVYEEEDSFAEAFDELAPARPPQQPFPRSPGGSHQDLAALMSGLDTSSDSFF